MSRRPDRTGTPARLAKARRLTLEWLEGRDLLSLFTVTTAADNGNNTTPTPGSLRAAIVMLNADTSIGADSISFDIASSGVQTIALESALPNITHTVAIDGTTEPGYNSSTGAPLVAIDGSGAGAGANGLTITTGAGGSIIRGLSIVGFIPSSVTGGGEGIFLAGAGAAGGNQVFDDYLGIEPDGATAKGNGSGVLVFSPYNTIGGTTTLTSDVLSGNSSAGVVITGGSATGNIVTGDFIGTNAAGTAAVGNQFGVLVAASKNTIGGLANGAGNVISGNVGPMADTGAGIILEGPATNNLLLGNKIGTNAAGTLVVKPTGFTPPLTYSNTYGIYLGTPGGSTSDNLTGETIGGSVTGAGNLISGNFVGITGNIASSLIEGNTVGLNLAGTAPIPNGDGIVLGASLTTIGGSTPLARNVISGNSSATGDIGTGIQLSGTSDVVEENFIGVASSGLAATGTGNVVGLILGNLGTGAVLTSSTIGGSVEGEGNVISGNQSDAIDLDGEGGSDAFYGNLIGIDLGGNADPNVGSGISLTIPAPASTPTSPLILDDTIGGTALGAGNLIAHNFGAGVLVNDLYQTGVTGLGIRGNTIFANTSLGIDTQDTGVPVPTPLFLNGDSVSNGQVTVTGVYFDAPSTTVSIDLFANAADPSGFGQGPVFLGTVSATTNGTGFATFSGSFASPSTPYGSFSATYTGTNGNTSEFTANFPSVLSGAQADLKVSAAASAATVTVGSSLTLVETVTNSGPSTASGVMLYDSLPVSLANVSVTSTVGSATVGSNNVITANIGSLAPNATAQVIITGMPSLAGTVVDQPGVSSLTYDPNYVNNTTQQTVIVNAASTGPSADLAILSAASTTSPQIGTPFTYNLSVGNLGPNNAVPAAGASGGVVVFDTIPINTTLKSVTTSQGTYSVSGNAITLSLGSMNEGAVATISIVVVPTASGAITNQASVSVTLPIYDPNKANNFTSVTTTVGTSIDLYLAMSPFPVAAGAVGQFQAFTMTVENFGPSTATDVTLIDNLPANTTFYSAKATQGGLGSIVNGQLIQNFGTLAAGGIASIQLIVIPSAAAVGPLTNSAGVYTPDDLAAKPSYALSTVPVVAGPSVSSINGAGNNAEIVLTFNEAMNPTTATNLANYQLVSLGTMGNGPAQTIKIALITYNQVAHTVMILPAQAIDPTQYYRLTLIGNTSTGIADTFGHRLASVQYGPAGNNFAATFFAGTLPQS